MLIRIILIIILLFFLKLTKAEAQESILQNTEHVFRNQRKNIVMLSFGYTYVPKGSALDHHESDGVFVPSVGLDYKRRISQNWALSLFTDSELDHCLLIHKEFAIIPITMIFNRMEKKYVVPETQIND